MKRLALASRDSAGVAEEKACHVTGHGVPVIWVFASISLSLPPLPGGNFHHITECLRLEETSGSDLQGHLV